jgi:methionyl-tRNA formyltransferase
MVASCSQTDNTPGAIAIIDKRLYIGTANGSVEITDIKPVGKKEMPVKAFLAGYKDKLQA